MGFIGKCYVYLSGIKSYDVRGFVNYFIATNFLS